MQQFTNNEQRRKSKSWLTLRLLLYVIVALLPVILEMGDEPETYANKSIVNARTIYQKFATLGYRKPRRHSVRIVALTNGVEPEDVLNNACRKREFVGSVLQKLSSVNPSVVVLDFWYPPGSCIGENASKDKFLQDAIDDASRQFPVVAGLNSATLSELESDHDPDLDKLKNAGFNRDDQILTEKVEFHGSNVDYGLLRIDLDTARLPILWQVFKDKKSVLAKASREKEPTLPYVAALKRDPYLRSRFNSDERPFTTFIPEGEFEIVSALGLLCDSPKPSIDWKNCKPSDTTTAEYERLKQGQIVIIAENSTRDRHPSPFGLVSGYVLLANYIEALLDDRYFWPISPAKESLLSIIFALAFVVIFEVSGGIKAAARAFLLLLVVTIICNILLVYFGWFIVFWRLLWVTYFAELGFAVKSKLAPNLGTYERHQKAAQAAEAK